MTTQDQLMRARLGILAMAAELKNVARACKLVGMSRSQFYAMKKAYETYGKEGLAPRVRRKPEMPNRTPAQMEAQILLQTSGNPIVSYIRLAASMKLQGICVSPTMVRYVWQRHGLSVRSARLRWVKRQNGQSGERESEEVHIRCKEVMQKDTSPSNAMPSSP
jgi:hypothetical protein